MAFRPAQSTTQAQNTGGFRPLDPDQDHLGVKSKSVLGTQPKSSFGKRFKEQAKAGFKQLIDPTIGALKGAGSTLVGASELGQRGLNILTPGSREVKRPEALKQALTPTTAGQKIGFGAEQVGEFLLPGAAGLKLGKGARLAAKIGVGAAEAGGITALQTGKVGTETAIAAGLGGSLPALGAGLKAFFGPARLVNKAVGITGQQSNKLNQIAMTPQVAKIGEKAKPIYESFQDFALKKGLLGKGRQIFSRKDMLAKAETLFDTAKGSKKDLLKGITKKTPNKFNKLLGFLEGQFDTLGQEKNLAKIRSLTKKKSLTGVDLDDIRRLADDVLPRGAFSGAEPVKTQGIQQAIDPLRRLLEKLDKSGSIRQSNTDIRILKQLIGESGFLTKAAEKSPFGAATFKGGLAGASSLIPVVGPAVSAISAAEAALTFPQISGPAARIAKGVSGKAFPDLVQKTLKAGAIRGATALQQ